MEEGRAESDWQNGMRRAEVAEAERAAAEAAYAALRRVEAEKEALEFEREVLAGLGRIVALYCRTSASYQMH